MKCYSHLWEENMSDDKRGLIIKATFPTVKDTLRAKIEMVNAIRAHGGHGQCREVPLSQLTGPNSPIKIESNDSNKDRK